MWLQTSANHSCRLMAGSSCWMIGARAENQSFALDITLVAVQVSGEVVMVAPQLSQILFICSHLHIMI